MYVIVGGGRIGKELAEKMGDAIILEKDPSRVDFLSKEGFNVFPGDAESEGSFLNIDLKNSKVVLATNNDSTNITVAKIALKRGAAEIIARVENPEYADVYKELGVTCISCQRSIASDILTEVAESNRRYFEINVTEKSHLSGKALKDVFIGILLTTQFSLVIAGASIGYELGLINKGEEATIVFFAIISCLLYPTLYRLFFGREGKKIMGENKKMIDASRKTMGAEN